MLVEPLDDPVKRLVGAVDLNAGEERISQSCAEMSSGAFEDY